MLLAKLSFENIISKPRPLLKHEIKIAMQHKEAMQVKPLHKNQNQFTA